MSNALAWARQYIAVPDAMYREYVEELLRMAEMADKAEAALWVDTDAMPSDISIERRKRAMEIIDNLMSFGFESGTIVDDTARCIEFDGKSLRAAHVSSGGVSFEFRVEDKPTANFTLSYRACEVLLAMIAYQLDHKPEAAR